MQGAEMMANRWVRASKGATETGVRKRSHFLPGEALESLRPCFFDENYCRFWILGKMLPGGVTCPECGARPTPKLLNGFELGQRIKCPACGKYYKDTTGTFLAGMQFSWAGFYLLAVLIALGQSTTTIARILDTDPGTVRLWKRKFENLELVDKQ